MMNKNKVIAASALALTITWTSGAVLAGQAFAAANSAAAAAESTTGQSGAKELMKSGGGDHGFRAKLDDSKVAALLGMTEDELKTARKAGQSLAAIAEEKGVAVQSVIDLVSKELTANLDQRLEDGKMTKEQYDAAIAGLAEKAAGYVNGSFEGKGGHGKGERAKLDESGIAELLGMTDADYETARKSGRSIAALAEEKGVSLQSVTDLVANQLRARLDQQLADGKVTQEQYDDKLAALADKASRLVNSAHAGKGGHRGHGPKASAETADSADKDGAASAV